MKSRNYAYTFTVSSPPTADATIDALWDEIDPYTIETEVPSYNFPVDGHDIWWDEYEGTGTSLTMKSVYTEEDIYFLFQWDDTEDSKTRMAWYYNQSGGKWLQMGKKYPDEFGNSPAYEDKFTMFWNISISDFPENGCQPLCHGANMATNNPGDMADIWHWKRDRNGPVNQVDDKWLDDETNGRHGDGGTSSYSSNTQTLITTAGDTLDAPEYWIPGRTDYHWILQSEIDDGTARKIVDLNADGNFVDEDGTVLEKSEFGYSSNKVIPSLKGIQPATGSRGDVSAWHKWENGKWTLKIKRARDTGNDDDLQFTTPGDEYWFSVGIMDAAAIAHALPDGFSGTAYRMILEE